METRRQDRIQLLFHLSGNVCHNVYLSGTGLIAVAKIGINQPNWQVSKISKPDKIGKTGELAILAKLARQPNWQGGETGKISKIGKISESAKLVKSVNQKNW